MFNLVSLHCFSFINMSIKMKVYERFFCFCFSVDFFFVVRARYRYIIKHAPCLFIDSSFVFVADAACRCSLLKMESIKKPFIPKQQRMTKPERKKQEQIWCVVRRVNRMSVPNRMIFQISNSIIVHEQKRQPGDRRRKKKKNTYHVTFCVNYIGTIDQNQRKLKSKVVHVFTFLSILNYHSKSTSHWRRIKIVTSRQSPKLYKQ